MFHRGSCIKSLPQAGVVRPSGLNAGSRVERLGSRVRAWGDVIRVLLSVLVITLTIASVHLQLSPILNRFDWAYRVHKALIFVCLTQCTMAAVWAATARGGRLGLWAHGMVLAIACTVLLFFGISGGHWTLLRRSRGRRSNHRIDATW